MARKSETRTTRCIRISCSLRRALPGSCIGGGGSVLRFRTLFCDCNVRAVPSEETARGKGSCYATRQAVKLRTAVQVLLGVFTLRPHAPTIECSHVRFEQFKVEPWKCLPVCLRLSFCSHEKRGETGRTNPELLPSFLQFDFGEELLFEAVFRRLFIQHLKQKPE